MFLIALGKRALARWVGAEREKNVRAKLKDCLTKNLRRRRDAMNTMETPKTVSLIFIERWTPKILFSLKERPYRHGQLRRQPGSVSERMLTRTLRNLESTGLIARRVIKLKTVAVEYSLTQLGRTIIAPLRGMCCWAQ